MRHILLYTLFFFLFQTFTFAQISSNSVFYRNAGANIEFRVVIEEDDQDTPWITLQDREGVPHKVTKEVVIGSQDIAGFTIEEGELTIHFNPDSWARVRKITNRIQGKYMAFVKSGKLFISAQVATPFSRSAQLNFGKNRKIVRSVLDELPEGDLPAFIETSDQYISFLEEWVKNQKTDKYDLVHLADIYFNDNGTQVDKALLIFKKVASIDPTDSGVQFRIVQCYIALSEYEQALITAQRSLSSMDKNEQIDMHKLLGDIHYSMGNKEDAIKSLELYIEEFQSLRFSDKEWAKPFHNARDKKIEIVRDQINYIKAH